MASPDAGDGTSGVATVIEVVESPTVAADTEEISPLLGDSASTATTLSIDRPNPKMSIFSVSYSRKRSSPKDNLVESLTASREAEVDVITQIVSWIWNGSRYSALLCVALSSVIYFVMEILIFLFPVRSIPLFQTLFTRSTIILLLSFLWLRRTGQPLFVPRHVRNLLIFRSLTGLISVLSFIYSVQNLPLSLAIILNFATPIMATMGATIILQEKLAISYSGGIACSYVGLVLTCMPSLLTRGDIIGDGEISRPVFAILIGICSSILGGISYCLIQAGAKASDHPAYTVLSFGLLASPLSAICMFALQKFVLPSVFALFLSVILGVLAFFAEICLARGLQLEKLSKVTNILYMKVLFSQVWGMIFLGAAVSFSKIIGCLLIFASISSTVYLGPEKEIE
ncbi:uncharacterized protein A4U43_C05F31850 [Asparagus officinalis]|uniref:EamA domain-containing protein n=1 Tax=Asparagus officinalis TaxID=4686 RepID=A0A5P1EVZ4_ASPOF|nr:uncharacterized protein LOC109841062 [Asparagus officinalis]ONK70255.1 uncharacterized protein A4U43_C05F31850 [Asparagus officinalis]